VRRAATAILLIAAAGCASGGAPRTVTPGPKIAELRADVHRLEQELVKSNVDQQDLRRRITEMYVERASRSSTAARGATLQPRQRATSAGVERWRQLVARYDWPVDSALAVMWCESRGDPNAYNASSGATGLFQILHGPLDPEANIALAYRMWRDRGWQPWNVGGCP